MTMKMKKNMLAQEKKPSVQIKSHQIKMKPLGSWSHLDGIQVSIIKPK